MNPVTGGPLCVVDEDQHHLSARQATMAAAPETERNYVNAEAGIDVQDLKWQPGGASNLCRSSPQCKTSTRNRQQTETVDPTG